MHSSRTRGHSRSKPIDEVIGDVRRALAAGYKEVALTGVHLGSYGRDLPRPSTLAELLRRLAEWPDDVLFRVSSLEPMDCTPDLVSLAAASPRIAPHFIALQQGAEPCSRHATTVYRPTIELFPDRTACAAVDRVGRLWFGEKPRAVQGS